MKTITTPISSACPIQSERSLFSRSWPSPLAPTKDASTTIARHSMMTWLTPTISVGRAAGSSTFQSIWRAVQPAMMPASRTSGDTPFKPRMVSRAITGKAKMIVAIVPALCPMPMKIATGIM